MMNNQDGAMRSRLRIVDTTTPEFTGRPSVSVKRGGRRPKPQRVQNQQVEHAIPEHLPQWPLETLLVQRAVLEYGRRTAALGAQHGAQALKTLAMKIRELGPPTPALEQIMLEADGEAARLRMMLDQAVYEEDR